MRTLRHLHLSLKTKITTDGLLTKSWGLPRAVSLTAVMPVPYVAPNNRKKNTIFLKRKPIADRAKQPLQRKRQLSTNKKGKSEQKNKNKMHRQSMRFRVFLFGRVNAFFSKKATKKIYCTGFGDTYETFLFFQIYRHTLEKKTDKKRRLVKLVGTSALASSCC